MRNRWAIAFGLVLVSCGSDRSEIGQQPTVSTPGPTSSVPAARESASSTSSTSSTSLVSPSAQPLFDFSRDGVDGWYVQNDTVMGGVSSSSVDVEQGAMVFSGTLSLDNNGGFVSVRGPILDPGSVETGNALSIDAQGDGRIYLVQILTPTDSYVSRFVPSDGPVIVPFSDFTATGWRLDPVPAVAPLDAASIGQIAVYLLDEQEGEFELRVRSISVIEE